MRHAIPEGSAAAIMDVDIAAREHSRTISLGLRWRWRPANGSSRGHWATRNCSMRRHARRARHLHLLAHKKTLAALSLALLTATCSSDPLDDGANPFTDDLFDDDKADSAYTNPDGVEIEVEVEVLSFRLEDGPAMIGQFAMTYFRKQADHRIARLAGC